MLGQRHSAAADSIQGADRDPGVSPDTMELISPRATDVAAVTAVAVTVTTRPVRAMA